MKIVQFNDGTYGVKRGFWICTSFLSTTYSYWWSSSDNINKWCKFRTLEAAKKRRDEYKKPQWEVINEH